MCMHRAYVFVYVYVFFCVILRSVYLKWWRRSLQGHTRLFFVNEKQTLSRMRESTTTCKAGGFDFAHLGVFTPLKAGDDKGTSVL